MKRVFSLLANLASAFNALSLSNSVFVLFCVLTACNNLGSKYGAIPINNVSLSDPNTGTSSGAFQLNTVTPDPNNLGSQYALIGSGSQFDTYCGGTLGTCNCEFTYTQPGVGQQVVDVANTYQESNLIRCPSTAVPSGINTFVVKIVVVPSTTASPAPTSTPGTVVYYSNSITVNLSTDGAFAGSDNYVDLTNASTYVQAQRFQCRKRDFIVNPLDNNIIDPFQSQDPRVIYPFNYYTTNVSDSLLTLQQLGNQSWECSLTGGVMPTPAPGGASPINPVQWWANPNVFSSTACSTSFCSGDQQLIYPQTSLSSGKIPVTNLAQTGKRRASFWLSSTSYGVFQIPIKAATSPIDYVSAKYSVIGYAAQTVPSVGNTSSCPNIPLPAKATWVKLWNFRANDITSPQVVTGSQSATNSTITCNTTGVFPSCDGLVPPAKTTAFGRDLASATNAPLPNPSPAARVALLSGSVGPSTESACYMIDVNSWASAGENWLPSPNFFDKTFSPQVSTTVANSFPWNVYAQSSTMATYTNCGSPGGSAYLWYDEDAITAVGHGCGASTYALPAATPQDNKTQLTLKPLQTGNLPYSDQLFVVTDPSVNDAYMKASSSAVSQYIPLTYRSFQDCPGPTTNSTTCQNAKPISWLNNAKAVDNPTATQADLYPVCVLQFYD